MGGNDQCSKRQREFMEELRARRGMHYGDLLNLAIDISGRQINDIGDLTIAEASEVINELLR
ncbi:MAG TPA: hypothetical protein PK157_22305 [Bryobacteraceae bacterium]|mgnify:FL=1|nr:hypothetical protein [Bryobacteraceae bacterium]